MSLFPAMQTPKDIISYICSFLHYSDLKNCRFLNKTWYQTVKQRICKLYPEKQRWETMSKIVSEETSNNPKMIQFDIDSITSLYNAIDKFQKDYNISLIHESTTIQKFIMHKSFRTTNFHQFNNDYFVGIGIDNNMLDLFKIESNRIKRIRQIQLVVIDALNIDRLSNLQFKVISDLNKNGFGIIAQKYDSTWMIAFTYLTIIELLQCKETIHDLKYMEDGPFSLTKINVFNGMFYSVSEYTDYQLEWLQFSLQNQPFIVDKKKCNPYRCTIDPFHVIDNELVVVNYEKGFFKYISEERLYKIGNFGFNHIGTNYFLSGNHLFFTDFKHHEQLSHQFNLSVKGSFFVSQDIWNLWLYYLQGKQIKKISLPIDIWSDICSLGQFSLELFSRGVLQFDQDLMLNIYLFH